MATVEQKSVEATQNGGADGRTFAVDNPATGEHVIRLPDMDAGRVRELVARARVAQKAGAEQSFDNRAAVRYRARKWMVDNRGRIAETGREGDGSTRAD